MLFCHARAEKRSNLKYQKNQIERGNERGNIQQTDEDNGLPAIEPVKPVCLQLPPSTGGYHRYSQVKTPAAF
jgi:hypothetical protein